MAFLLEWACGYIAKALYNALCVQDVYVYVFVYARSDKALRLILSFL